MDTNPSTPTPPKAEVFHAYTAPPEKKKWWRWILIGLVVAAGAYALAARRDPRSYTVISKYGIREVRLEMTTNQVVSVLGDPIAQSADGCYRYGMPQLNRDYDVYKICFDDGRVSAVKTERFEVREIPRGELPVE